MIGGDSAVVVMLVLLLVLLAAGIHVSFALGLAGIAGLYFGFGGNLYVLKIIAWNVSNSSSMFAICLFLFMGELLVQAGISKQLYDASSYWVEGIPGRLLNVNIVASTIFAATSGSSVATAAAFGSIAHNEGKARGYRTGLNLGCLAAGATLGVLIPPSVPMIVYGILAEQSIGDLFIGGIIPGIMISALFILFVIVRSLINPRLVPAETVRHSWKERFSILPKLIPWVIIIVGVLGVIYLGIATPNEAAGIGCIVALALGILYRSLSLKGLAAAGINAALVTAMCLFLLIGASMVSYVLASSGVTQRIVGSVMASGLPPYLVLTFVCLVYLVLGCFIDSYSMLVLTVPVMRPIMQALGFDLIWFGVLATILVEIGLITPPFGANVFVLDGATGGGNYEEITRGVIPYVFVLLLGVLLVIIFPSLVLWLPSKMQR